MSNRKFTPKRRKKKKKLLIKFQKKRYLMTTVFFHTIQAFFEDRHDETEKKKMFHSKCVSRSPRTMESLFNLIEFARNSFGANVDCDDSSRLFLEHPFEKLTLEIWDTFNVRCIIQVHHVEPKRYLKSNIWSGEKNIDEMIPKKTLNCFFSPWLLLLLSLAFLFHSHYTLGKKCFCFSIFFRVHCFSGK